MNRIYMHKTNPMKNDRPTPTVFDREYKYIIMRGGVVLMEARKQTVKMNTLTIYKYFDLNKQ